MTVDYASLTALVSLADVKARLGITDTSEDTVLTALIQVATGAIHDFLGYDITSQSRSEIYSGDGRKTLYPRHTPITAVSSLTVNGVAISAAASVNTAGYVISNQRIDLRGHDFLKGIQNIALSYTAGYATVPAAVAEAAAMQVHGLFNARTVDPNVTSESVPGVYSASYRQEGAGSLPPAAKMMLQPFVRVTY